MPRPSRVIVTVALSVVLAAGVAASATAGRAALLIPVAIIQLLLAVGWAVSASTHLWRVGIVIVASAAADDLVVLAHTAPRLGPLAGVVALTVAAALLGELLDRHRSAVTATLAGVVGAALLCAASATALALAAVRGGPGALVATAVAAGVAAATATALARWRWGVVLGWAAGLLAGLVVGATGSLGLTRGLLVGLAAAAVGGATATLLGNEQQPTAATAAAASPGRVGAPTGGYVRVGVVLAAATTPLAVGLSAGYLVSRLVLG